jgi:rRNA maturation protein Nop10
MQEFLRTFKQFDINEVKKHLLIMGDLSSDCASCRHLGIDAYTAKTCPECGTPFKYISSRRLEANPGERFQFAKRAHEKRPDLIPIDYTDYTKVLGQKKARDFFA